MLLIIIVVIVLVVILIIMHRRKNKGTRSKRNKKRSYMKTATDSAKEVFAEHMKNPQDPLVLAYNRPDLLATNPILRRDVTARMHRTIMDEHFDDIEMLERIVNINEEFDLDRNIAVAAPAIAARTAVGRTFDDRLRDIAKIADDPQNVHDPSIIKQLNETLINTSPVISGGGALPNSQRAQLKTSVDNTIDDLLRRGEISDSRANAARIVATKMINSSDTCSSYNGRHENEIFNTTWSAADTADKRHNFILGLADSHTGGASTVCMNGRLARIIGANSMQASSADLKSSVYSYAGKIMNEGRPFAEVEHYINEIQDMPMSQKTMLISECRAVFDENDLPDIGPSPGPAVQNNVTREAVQNIVQDIQTESRPAVVEAVQAAVQETASNVIATESSTNTESRQENGPVNNNHDGNAIM